MKAINLFQALSLIVFTAIAAIAFSCNSSAQDASNSDTKGAILSTDQNSKTETIEFKVTGNCEMCKKTIESSVKDEDGVKSAVWNQKTKMMKVTFDPSKISESTIHEKIAASGYDTEKKEASDQAYNSLPGCCQYDRTLHEGHSH